MKKLLIWLIFGSILATPLIKWGASTSERLAANVSAQVTQPLPPVLITDSEFQLSDWEVSAQTTNGASYSISQQLTGGLGGSEYRKITHALPPATGDELTTVFTNHVFQGYTYEPATQGTITRIDYSEWGIILSFPFPEAFSTTQPIIWQGGRIFRSVRFIRFIAENSSHDWESGSLPDLVETDFLAVDGSGDHPVFSADGSAIKFGFTRINSRSSTQPEVPPDESMIVEQGVDFWQLFVYRMAAEEENLPPVAVDDVFILNGFRRNLPLLEILNLSNNDTDPNQDVLQISGVTEPQYGSADILSRSSVAYRLDVAQPTDRFTYTISDDFLTDEANVDVLIDCACSVLCLNSLEPPETISVRKAADDCIDLPLIYRVRDNILKSTADGARYVNMYYTSNPEILVNLLMFDSLREEATATVELWQDNLRSLVDGNGSAVITQPQVDALDNFLNSLAAMSSTHLQTLIANERTRLGPLDDYVGKTMREAKTQAIGDPVYYLPVIR